jgi:undecaprenyl-diphosphatase
MYFGSRNYKIAISCGIALLIVLMSGAFAIHLEPIMRLDRAILEWFATSRTVVRDQLFVSITWAGSSFILLPVILAQAFKMTIRKNNQDALFLLGSYCGASMLSITVKLAVMRPRPAHFPALIDIPAGFSFPSSHAVQITAFVLAELLLLNALTRARWLFLLNLAGGGLIFLVCISRLYLQVHYTTDIAAGFLTALLWVVGLAAVMRSDYNKQAFWDGFFLRKENNDEK